MSITNSLKTLTTKEVWAEFKKAVARTAEGIARMAECWCELEERGEDLTCYRNPMLSFLPDVANGKLLPEVLLRYGASPSLTGAIAALVPEDQAKLAKADARVAVLNPDGTTHKKRITDLRQAEIRQVLGDGRIRTVAEQQKHLAPAPRTFGSRPGGAKAINSDFDLYAMLTPDQRKRITELADAKGMTPAEFAVDAMIRHRLIPGKPAIASGFDWKAQAEANRAAA